MRTIRLLGCLVMVTATAGQVQAGNIVGGSALLSSGDVAELETWLGEGSLTLTNIYTKTSGDTSLDFHAAVDGTGRTFSIIEILGENGFAHQVVGGYNPLSWNSFGGFHETVDPADRTAFLFNLTTDLLQPQKLGSQGLVQTYNHSTVGPTFGNGFDLHVETNLLSGVAFSTAYGAEGGFNDGVLIGRPYDGVFFSVGGIEVFTISTDISSVPEPSSIALLALGGTSLAVSAFRRRRQVQVAA